MRLVDIDDIRVMKFLSEEDDTSESNGEREYRNGWNDALTAVNDIQPSAEPEMSRIERELHGKTPEEQYDFIYWLLFKSFEATAYSNSRLAIIDWLKGEEDDCK